MINGMMFGGEGPVMQGTWYNPHTGDAFTVRDSFFEDNQYVVTTTDGRYLRYDQIQNYVQSDMKLEDLKKLKTNTPVQPKEELPAAVADLISEDTTYSDLMIPEDDIISRPMSVQPKLGNLYAEPVSMPMNETSMNDAIIEKALKSASRPNFSVNVVWDDFPEKQIDMLKDVMDIPEESIIEWYLDNISMIDVVERLKTAIKEHIIKQYDNNLFESLTAEAAEYVAPQANAEEQPTVLNDSETVEKKPKKKNTKPTKSKKV